VAVQATRGASIFALQIALAMSATIIATSSDEKLKTMVLLGTGYAINSSEAPTWSQKGREFTYGKSAYTVIDVGGQSILTESFNAVRLGGIISQKGSLPPKDDFGKVDAPLRTTQTQAWDSGG